MKLYHLICYIAYYAIQFPAGLLLLVYLSVRETVARRLNVPRREENDVTR